MFSGQDVKVILIGLFHVSQVDVKVFPIGPFHTYTSIQDLLKCIIVP